MERLCVLAQALIYLPATFTYLSRPAAQPVVCRVGNGCKHVAHRQGLPHAQRHTHHQPNKKVTSVFPVHPTHQRQVPNEAITPPCVRGCWR